jgi:hypothetical protein
MDHWWERYMGWMPEWLQAIVLIILLVWVLRLVFGTSGLSGKLDEIKSTIAIAGDANLDAWRAENRHAKDEILGEIRKLQSEISDLKSEVAGLRNY